MNIVRKFHELDDVDGFEAVDIDFPDFVGGWRFYNAKTEMLRSVSIDSNVSIIRFFKVKNINTDRAWSRLHRDGDLPSVLHLQANQNYKLSKVFYHKMGEAHRDEELGPQEIHYNYNGHIVFFTYRKYGNIHRTDKPAIIISSKDYYSYYRNNTLHRLDGPAMRNGSAYTWFVNGQPIDRKIFPIFKNKKIINKIPLTRKLVMDAMFFDRDYGKFLNEKFQESSMGS